MSTEDESHMPPVIAHECLDPYCTVILTALKSDIEHQARNEIRAAEHVRTHPGHKIELREIK